MIDDDDGFTRLVRSDSVHEGAMSVGRVGIRQVAVARVDGALYAFRNTCPHAGSPLSGGHLKGCKVICARHGWGFDLASGACTTQPMYSLRLYEVRERDGWVEVREAEPEIW